MERNGAHRSHDRGADKSHTQATPETLHLQVDAIKGCGGLDLDQKENGAVRATQGNAITLLAKHPRWLGVIGYDLRAETACFLKAPPAWSSREVRLPRAIGDTDVTAIIAWLCQQTGAEFAVLKVQAAIDFVARENAFDPVATYLTGLRWDGISRIDDWLVMYLGAEHAAFARVVGPKFLISAVARALRPGCQVDHVLVLEGPQGAGKTSALRVLAAPWHRADPPALGTRDAKEALRGAWIVEIGELDGMNRSEVSTVKNFLSQTEDHYRLPYGRRSETRPRRVVFAATTNEAEYLRDQTGNRRFWPIACGAIDLQGLARDREQLWAEAVVRLGRGEPWHLTSQVEIALAQEQQEARRESDPWEDELAKLAASYREFTLAQVFAHLAIPLDRQTQREKNRIGRILKRFGYRLEQKRVEGSARTRVYRRASSARERPAPSQVSRTAAGDPLARDIAAPSQLETCDMRDGDPAPWRPR